MTNKLRDFLPLISIASLILLLTTGMVLHLGHWDTMYAMRYFEGFFFVIFGAFKLINWQGFAHGYAKYDIIAKRSKIYSYAYPLIELTLGLGYLFNFYVLQIAYVTLALMIIGSIGVAQKLLQKEQITCACLGAVFKIPMTWVTLIEDLIMAVMALIMILIHY